jgi:hypothetical protein
MRNRSFSPKERKMVYPHVTYLRPAHADPAKEGRAMIRELDSRITDGIFVRLLWHSDNGRVSITVDDAKTGDEFELAVREGEQALDVYHHPYAYAAQRCNDNGALSTPSGVGATA